MFYKYTATITFYNSFGAGRVFRRQNLTSVDGPRAERGNGNDMNDLQFHTGGGPRVVVITALFHARVWGSVPGLGGLKEAKCFFPIHV